MRVFTSRRRIHREQCRFLTRFFLTMGLLATAWLAMLAVRYLLRGF